MLAARPHPRGGARAMLRSALHALRRHGLGGSARAAQHRVCSGGASEAADAPPPLSRELLRCRTSKEFLSYALKRGAVVVRQRGTHATLQANGVSYTLVPTSKDLMDSARKFTFAVFERMGIARDARLKRGGEQGTQRQWSEATAANPRQAGPEP